MIMFSLEIEKFLGNFNYDIRKSGNGRWIDQKCTPDVLSIISECVVDFIKYKDNDVIFTSKDIWDSNYSSELIELYFNKPHPLDKKAVNEYDKFFAQPLKLLAYSNVLSEIKRGNRNCYQINNYEILEYISISDKNAYNFLLKYISKVLYDSNLIEFFDIFFENQTESNYEFVKSEYSKFIIHYTKINKQLEPRRIFTKVINPLACHNKKLGSERGRLSKNQIYFSDLLYNQLNFRDIYNNKPKGITRKEWREEQKLQPADKIINHKTKKAIDFLHKFNIKYRDNWSEVLDEHADYGTHMHHIFPKAKFPEISFFYENIIALSPTQHYTYAHPEGNTQKINLHYQKVLLESKAKRIDENIVSDKMESIYSFDNFIRVINEGFDKDYDVENNDYVNSLSIINECYKEILK